VRPPDQSRSRSRSRFSGGQKSPQNGSSGRAGGDRGNGSATVKYGRYLELAQQAKTAGDEVTAQHHLQHAEHWYRTAVAERGRADSAPVPTDA
jgi:hypothetical protein